MTMRETTAFRWPLTDEGRAMSFPELFGELLETISEINSRAEWPLVVIIPNPGDVTVDRAGGVITARCKWVRKSAVRHAR
jgi:cystathionine beta-lyase family protein involved in aluminum resistance